MKMGTIALLALVFLVGCRERIQGEVIGVDKEHDAMCTVPLATIQLDDGTVVLRCMNAPLGQRVAVDKKWWIE